MANHKRTIHRKATHEATRRSFLQGGKPKAPAPSSFIGAVKELRDMSAKELAIPGRVPIKIQYVQGHCAQPVPVVINNGQSVQVFIIGGSSLFEAQVLQAAGLLAQAHTAAGRDYDPQAVGDAAIQLVKGCQRAMTAEAEAMMQAQKEAAEQAAKEAAANGEAPAEPSRIITG